MLLTMTAEVEEAILEFLIKTLSDEDLKQITSKTDILIELENNPDAESDLKELVWELMKPKIRYWKIIDEIRERYAEEDSEEEQ